LSWDETDLQRVLTHAVPRYVEFLSERAHEALRFECITRANSNQNPDDPNAVGVDMLSILAADKLLAMELKKCLFDDEGKNPQIGKFAEGQLSLLERMVTHPSVSAYVVYNTLPEFECAHLPHGPQRIVAQLSAMTALPPKMFKYKQETLHSLFAGHESVGATVLDVMTNALLQRVPNIEMPFVQWLEFFQTSIGSMNNAVLWFISDGYVRGLTLAELRAALPQLLQVQSSSEGVVLIKAYRLRQHYRRHRSGDAQAIQTAEVTYNLAQQAYLASVRQHAIDLAKIQRSSGYEKFAEDEADEQPPLQLGYEEPYEGP
jgi:hypothetical protein